MGCNLVLVRRQSVECLRVEEHLVPLRHLLVIWVVKGRVVSFHVRIHVPHRCIVHHHGAAIFH